MICFKSFNYYLTGREETEGVGGGFLRQVLEAVGPQLEELALEGQFQGDGGHSQTNQLEDVLQKQRPNE